MQDIVSDHAERSAGTYGQHSVSADMQLRGAPHQAYLLVRDMTCPACAMRVRSALLAVEGVLNAGVLLDQGVALVHFDDERVNLEDLTSAVMRADSSGRHTYGARVLNGLP